MLLGVCVCLSSDPMEELHDSSPQTASNSAAELLKQGAGSVLSVWILHLQAASFGLEQAAAWVYDDMRVTFAYFSVQTRAEVGVCMCL